MRYPAAEKLEIIRTVEDRALGIARTLRQVGIPQSTFYHWDDRFLTGGVEGRADRKPTPPRQLEQGAGGATPGPG